MNQLSCNADRGYRWIQCERKRAPLWLADGSLRECEAPEVLTAPGASFLGSGGRQPKDSGTDSRIRGRC